MKKLMAVLVFLLVLTGCSETSNITKVKSEDEMLEKTGYDIVMPNEASDVSYYVGKNDNGDYGKACFLIDKVKACVVVQASELTQLAEEKDAIVELLDRDYGVVDNLNVSDYEARAYLGEKHGYLAFIDSNSGYLYNVEIQEKTTAEELASIANLLFKSEEVDMTSGEESGELEYMISLVETIYDVAPGTAGTSLRLQAALVVLDDYVGKHGTSVDGDVVNSAIDAFVVVYNDEEARSRLVESLDYVYGNITNTAVQEFINNIKMVAKLPAGLNSSNLNK